MKNIEFCGLNIVSALHLPTLVFLALPTKLFKTSCYIFCHTDHSLSALHLLVPLKCPWTGVLISPARKKCTYISHSKHRALDCHLNISRISKILPASETSSLSLNQVCRTYLGGRHPGISRSVRWMYMLLTFRVSFTGISSSPTCFVFLSIGCAAASVGCGD